MSGLLKGKEPSQRDEEILNLLYKFGFTLGIDDLDRGSKIAIYLFNIACKMNFSKSSDAVSVIMGFSAIIALTKSTYNLPKKLLQLCYEKMDRNSIKNMVNYKFVRSIVYFHSGEWDKIKQNDIENVNKACKAGIIESATTYLWFIMAVAINKGNFHNAQEMISLCLKIAAEYDYDLAKLFGYSQKTLYFLTKRQLNSTIKFSNKSIEISHIQGREAPECSYLGMNAEALILFNNLTEAQKSIDKAKAIVIRQKSMNPGYSWPYHSSTFHIKIELLKQKMGTKDKQAIEEFKKDTLKCGKDILKIYKNYAPSLPWSFRMMGELNWITGRQKKALKWWTKAIKTGEKLGARPELSRTYFGVGKSLLTPESKYKHLNGITAQEYLDKAKTMFAEMDLQWDLNELEKVSMAN